MVYSMDLDITDPGAQRSVRDFIDKAFLLLYCVELASKLMVHRLFYFWNEDMAWNTMDFLLVMQSLSEAIIAATSDGKGGGALWMRTLRLFRVAKVLRLVRVFKMFTELRLIMTAMVSSFASFFWSAVVIILLSLIFSLYFVSNVAAFVQGDDNDKEAKQRVLNNFGSVHQCMQTLIYPTVLGGGDWLDYYEDLAPLGVTSVAFVVWVTFANIALINIVTGMFVDSAMKIAEGDIQMKAESRMDEEKQYAMGLWRLMRDADKDKNGVLDREEFDHMLNRGDLGAYLHYQGIDAMWLQEQIPVLWEELTEDQRKINASRFETGESDSMTASHVDCKLIVERCMELRHFARSAEIRELKTKLDTLLERGVQRAEGRIMSRPEDPRDAHHHANWSTRNAQDIAMN
jgi:hypothetical protein